MSAGHIGDQQVAAKQRLFNMTRHCKLFGRQPDRTLSDEFGCIRHRDSV